MLNKIKKFFVEVWLELKKVSWPTKQELRDSTLVVIISVFILGMIIAAFDQISSWIVNSILK
jgi:preprotein translocase subunit SecE